MIIDVTTCPHCGAQMVFGECTACFWFEEEIEVINVQVDVREFDFPFVME